jgi:peptide alpha-N-acetyltransferase
MVKLIEKDLSEPYSIFTYRYFLIPFPTLCELCYDGDRLVGVIICKLDNHKSGKLRGYIGMLAVDAEYRGKRIATRLVQTILERMKDMQADECVLEAETTNDGAIGLYLSIGFIKTKYLNNYYLSGSDAFRLKYFFR